MKRKGIFSLAAVCLLSVTLLPSTKQQTVSVSSSTEEEAMQSAQTLFPDLSDEDITDIRISAANNCEFSFNINEKKGLSVNGQKADKEIFSTLVDQILAPSFIRIDAFSPEKDPIMTLTIYTSEQNFNACFYSGDDNQKYTYVITDEEKNRYLKTDAWRIGTLLLTCEGTRIFDASGQETPVE